MVKYGWLNIDKAYGMSSGMVVGRIKSILRCKVGHAGTLDPLATGVLPIAFGEATKTVNYVVDTLKSYEVTAQWGIQRSTDDAEGNIVGISKKRPSLSDIKAVSEQFIGVIQQIPPAFSAIKVDGVRAYHISRSGGEVKLRSREVCITGIEVVEFDEENNTTKFIVTSHKGVYIRALIRDMGSILGCLGYVLRLRRTKEGIFSISKSITLKKLKVLQEESRLAEFVTPIGSVITSMPEIKVEDEIVREIKKGSSISLKDVSLNALYVTENCDMCYLSSTGSVPIAVCKVVEGFIRPLRVFNC